MGLLGLAKSLLQIRQALGPGDVDVEVLDVDVDLVRRRGQRLRSPDCPGGWLASPHSHVPAGRSVPAGPSATYKPFQLRISHFLGPVTTSLTTPVFPGISYCCAESVHTPPYNTNFFCRLWRLRMPSRHDQKGGDGMSISASSVTLAAWSRSSVKSGAGGLGKRVFGVRTASWEYRFRVDRAMGKAPVIARDSPGRGISALPGRVGLP